METFKELLRNSNRSKLNGQDVGLLRVVNYVNTLIVVEMQQGQSSQLRIMVIGADGVGKSWLVNRLVRYIETGCDDTLKELNEDQQTFRENRGPDHPMIEMPYPESITLDHKVITTETQEIVLEEFVGFKSIECMALSDQINWVGGSSTNFDYFIYVVRYDQQLTLEVLSILKRISCVCTKKKLLVFLNRKHTYAHNQSQLQKIQHWYRVYGTLYSYLVDDVPTLASIIQKELRSSRALIYAVGTPQLLHELRQKGYNVYAEHGDTNDKVEFDLFIIDNEYFKNPEHLPSFNPYKDILKCLIYFDPNAYRPEQNSRIPYMRGCSDEAIQAIIKRPEKITFAQCKQFIAEKYHQ